MPFEKKFQKYKICILFQAWLKLGNTEPDGTYNPSDPILHYQIHEIWWCTIQFNSSHNLYSKSSWKETSYINFQLHNLALIHMNWSEIGRPNAHKLHIQILFPVMSHLLCTVQFWFQEFDLPVMYDSIWNYCLGIQ